MSNANNIQAIMTSLNKYPQFGRIDVIDPTVDDIGLDDIQSGDMVIAPDFCDDELRETGDFDAVNELAEWYYEALHDQIDLRMAQLGYVKIHANDGSGGGLYYGITQYRKAASFY